MRQQDDVRYIDRIAYVLPCRLNVTRQTLIQVNEQDEIIHRVTLSRRQTDILASLFAAMLTPGSKGYLTYTEAESVANTSVITLRSSTLPKLNERIARFNMIIVAVVDHGYIVVSLHKKKEENNEQ